MTAKAILSSASLRVARYSIIGAGVASDDAEAVSDGTGAVSDNAEGFLGSSAVFSVLFSDDVVGSAITSDPIVVRADSCVGNGMRSTGSLTLNPYKTSDAESFVEAD